MIIRKPYAFLIKNFKKVHVALLAIAIYIYFKTTQTYSFVNEFISLNTYDYTNEPVSKYVNFIGIILLIILIAGSASLMLLLKKKDKPWKLYIIPTVQYIVIFFAFLAVSGFFKNYTGVESNSSLRMWRDFLFISQAVQLGVVVIYLIRIFGVDLNKFNFKLDEEYLELDQSDREELEISINIDKSAFKRLYRRFLRYFNYFYQEHKILCNIIIVIIVLIIGKNTYSYISSHRSFKEGDTFKVSSYTVKINNSYYSDKSYNGTVISKKSAFVIVDITIKNNANSTVTVDLNKYHVMNGVSNYTPTEKTYETEFKDLGKSYDSVSLKSDQEKRFLLIFKVDNKLKTNRFVLYYQEVGRSTKNLRKIKLKINDLSTIKTQDKLSLGDNLVLPLSDEENINFESYEILDTITYYNKICNSNNCVGTTSDYNAPTGYKILSIVFGSDTFEGEDMATYVKEHGKIKYTNSKGKTKEIAVENALHNVYYGKYLYLKVPNELATAKSINIEFIIRNYKYVYKIK